ncbi:MAG: hypothetical protein VZR02_04615 [Lachnospiraceae bacterium]|nr:hypothetical protein [Lachnospiraceae bacterium]
MDSTRNRGWKDLHGRERWQYFRDYSMEKTILIVAAVAFAILMLWNFLGSRAENVLSAAIFDETLDTAAEKDLMPAWREDLAIKDKKQIIYLDDSYSSTNANSLEKFTVIAANHAIDIVVADEETVRGFASYGYLEDLTPYLEGGALAAYQDLTVSAAGDKDTDAILSGETSSLGTGDDGDLLTTEDSGGEDSSAGKGEVKPYGLRLDTSTVWLKVRTKCAHPVVCIVYGTDHEKRAVAFIDALLKNSEQKGE